MRKFKKRLPAAMLVGLTLALVHSVRAQTESCELCAEIMELGKGDLNCLRQKIDKWIYFASSGTPTLINVGRCTAISGSDDELQGSTDIRGSAGSEESDEVIYYLAESQLKCLKAAMPRLVQFSNRRIKFDFSDCPS